MSGCSSWSALTLPSLCGGLTGCAESSLVGVLTVSCGQAKSKTTRKDSQYPAPRKETARGRAGDPSLAGRFIRRAVRPVRFPGYDRLHLQKKPLCRQPRCERMVCSCLLQLLSLQREDFSLQNASLARSLLSISNRSSGTNPLSQMACCQARRVGLLPVPAATLASAGPSSRHERWSCSRQQGAGPPAPGCLPGESEPEISGKILYLY